MQSNDHHASQGRATLAVLIATLEQSLLRWRIVSEFWRDALLGLLILLAVAADSVILRRLHAFWARGEIEQIQADDSLPVETA